MDKSLKGQWAQCGRCGMMYLAHHNHTRSECDRRLKQSTQQQQITQQVNVLAQQIKSAQQAEIDRLSTELAQADQELAKHRERVGMATCYWFVDDAFIVKIYKHFTKDVWFVQDMTTSYYLSSDGKWYRPTNDDHYPSADAAFAAFQAWKEKA